MRSATGSSPTKVRRRSMDRSRATPRPPARWMDRWRRAMEASGTWRCRSASRNFRSFCFPSKRPTRMSRLASGKEQLSRAWRTRRASGSFASGRASSVRSTVGAGASGMAESEGAKGSSRTTWRIESGPTRASAPAPSRARDEAWPSGSALSPSPSAVTASRSRSTSWSWQRDDGTSSPPTTSWALAPEPRSRGSCPVAKSPSRAPLRRAPPEEREDPSWEDRSPPTMNIDPSRMDRCPPRMDRRPSRMDEGPPRMDRCPPRMDRHPPRMDRRPPRMDRCPPRMDRRPSRMDRRPSRSRREPEPDSAISSKGYLIHVDGFRSSTSPCARSARSERGRCMGASRSSCGRSDGGPRRDGASTAGSAPPKAPGGRFLCPRLLA